MWAAGVVAPLFVFAALAVAVSAGDRPGFDRPLLEFAGREGGGAVASAMRLVSDLGGGRALGPAAAVLVVALLVRRRPAAALFMTLCALAAALNPPLKALFSRPRPDLFPPRASEGGWGFPSGHAMTATAILGGAAVLLWRTRARRPALAAAALGAAAVGASRVMLGVHYPSDVVAGWALSLAWVVALTLVFRRLEERRRAAARAPGATGGGRSAARGYSSGGRAGGVR